MHQWMVLVFQNHLLQNIRSKEELKTIQEYIDRIIEIQNEHCSEIIENVNSKIKFEDLTKSLEKDDLNAIKSCMEVKSGKYYRALCGVINND